MNYRTELDSLIGLRASVISDMRFQFDSEAHRIIYAAARVMSDNRMDAWTYAGMRPNGTTLWRASEGSHLMRVSRDGIIDSEF